MKIIASIGITIVVVFVALGLLMLISMWIIFDKAGEPGWAVLIPIYREMVFAEVGGLPSWVGILYILTGAIGYINPIGCMLLSTILWAVMSIAVAKAFDHGVLFGLGMVFFPLIFYPILAFGDR